MDGLGIRFGSSTAFSTFTSSSTSPVGHKSNRRRGTPSVIGLSHLQTLEPGRSVRSFPRRERPHVRFTVGGESGDDGDEQLLSDIQEGNEGTAPASERRPLGTTWKGTAEGKQEARGQRLGDGTEFGPYATYGVRDRLSAGPVVSDSQESEALSDRTYHRRYVNAFSQTTAHERAQTLARRVGKYTAVAPPTTSPAVSAPPSPPGGTQPQPMPLGSIPLVNLDKKRQAGDEDTESDEEAPPSERRKGTNTSEAHQLVRLHSGKELPSESQDRKPPVGARSGQVTPVADRDPRDYVPPPQQYRGSVLASILRLYKSSAPSWSNIGGPTFNPARPRHGSGEATPRDSPGQVIGTPGSSGHGTPRPKQQRWYSKSRNPSSNSLAGLIESSSILAAPAAGPSAEPALGPKGQRRTPPGGRVGAALNRLSRPRLEDEIRITVHIAETLARQKYLIKLCRALMSYGAPTHRLEGESFAALNLV